MSNRSRGKFDITLEASDVKLGFNLAREAGRPAVVTTELSPGRLDEQARNADVPRIIDNLDAGMGFSRRVESVPNGYAYTHPGYTRAPGGIFCPAGKVTEIPLPGAGSWDPAPIFDSQSFEEQIWLINQGRHVLRLNADWAGVTVTNAFAAGFTGEHAAVFNNRLYFSGGGGLAYHDAGGGYSGIFAVPRINLGVANWRPLGVPTDVLIGVSSQNNWSSVRWCPITADPTIDGSWSSPVAVGADRRYPINRTVTAPRHAFFFRPDGVYDMDELGARAFNIAPWVREGADSNNGIWGISIGSDLYYSHSQGLALVPTSGEAQYEPVWAHPGWGLPYEGAVRGQPFSGTLHNGWALLGIGDAQTTYICAGRRDQNAFGAATHVWHGAEAVLNGRITHMKVHPSGPGGSWPRLLIATIEAGTPNVHRLYWQSLSKLGTPVQELLLGGEFSPADASSLFLPADPWDRPSSVKTMLQFDLLTERLTEANILKLYAGADEGGYTEQGATVDGTYSSFAPLELTEGRYIRTRIDAIGSPILRSVELRAAVGVDLREARVYTVILGYDNALKTGASRETRDPERRMMDLRTMLGRVVILEDEYPMRVRVLQVMAPERRQLGAPNRAGAWALVVSFSVSILDHPFRWDGADRYDTDRTWG